MIKRGDIRNFLTPEALEKWFSIQGSTGGLVCSLFKMMGINLPVPHYSTVCKRQANLNVELLKKKTNKAKTLLDLIFDSTGLKGYGESEWKIKVHDKSKARCWRMLYIAMRPDTFEIVAMELKDNRAADCKILPIILGRVKHSAEIGKVYGDKGYTSIACFAAV